MSHYIKLYFASIKRSIMSRLEFKKDLLISALGFVFENVCAILSIYFIVTSIPALNVPGQGVWDIWQIGFLYGFAMIPKGIDHLFTDELWLVAYRRVTDGSMDKEFMRPVPVLFSIISQTFQPEGFSEIIVGAAMLIICGLQPSVTLIWNVGNVVLIIVACIFGAILITGIKILVAGLAFVMKRSGPLLQIMYNCITYVKYPKNIYPYFIRVILVGIIPFGLIISMPIEIFLGFSSFNPWVLCGIIIGASIVLLALSIFVWTLCAKKYESTGN